MLIRLAEQADSGAIRRIYNQEVRQSAATFDLVERTPEGQAAWLSERSGAFSVLVAEFDNLIVGFAALSPYKERAAYRTTVENSVYVDPDSRGRGVADGLLVELLAVARTSGFHVVVARIGGGNEASIALHSAGGIRTVGTKERIGRLYGRWRDTVFMERRSDVGGA